MSFIPIIYHIPHASRHIPEDIYTEFCITKDQLNEEIRLMTDHYTDNLFIRNIDEKDSIIEFPVSRLVVDPERFSQDNNEPMAQIGMGVVYLKRHDGQFLRVNNFNKENLLNRFYYPHHKNVENCVSQLVREYRKILIIDCHSYPKSPLPYELNKSGERPQICLGTDPYHTPAYLQRAFEHSFKKAEFSVAFNTPFSGTFVPIQFLNQDPSVLSIMIEVRRDVYMDEIAGLAHEKFDYVANTIARIINEVRDEIMHEIT